MSNPQFCIYVKYQNFASIHIKLCSITASYTSMRLLLSILHCNVATSKFCHILSNRHPKFHAFLYVSNRYNKNAVIHIYRNNINYTQNNAHNFLISIVNIENKIKLQFKTAYLKIAANCHLDYTIYAWIICQTPLII